MGQLATRPHSKRRGPGALKLVALALGGAGGFWLATRPRGPVSAQNPSPAARIFMDVVERVDWTIGWDKLPLLPGLASLVGFRMRMRQMNLTDTTGGKVPEPRHAAPEEHHAHEAHIQTPSGARHLTARTPDGTYNDLTDPFMGSAGTRFGRNVPLDATFPEAEPAILTPNPRTVSRELLTRTSFKPASTLNLLAAAWLQFMVHDWLSHGKNEKAIGSPRRPWELPLADDDPWPERPMTILRSRRDPTRTEDERDLPPTYINVSTHWWDASQIYGNSAPTQARVRSGRDGKLKIEPDGLLPLDPETGTDVTGVMGNWWLGLSLMHTLFTLEHNAICDRLRREYPTWGDDDLFDHARLVNAALIAKIHTVEWTTAILGHPTMQVAMRGNWWGAEMERISRTLGRLSKNEVISGIPGSDTDHFGVPYSITEEFVSVYRMHPLIPDDFSFRAAKDDGLIAERTFQEVADRNARATLEQVPIADAFYSFGTMHPGAVTLHNFPKFLQHRVEGDGTQFDLAAIDILRTRERGVPRYNEFRKYMHKQPVKTFEELTDNPVWAEEIRRVYDGDIDRVDLIVGLFAEPVPEGFGFSDTAFRIFTLMASRRLNSDRFFTTDYTENVYTKVGMDWIEDNTMSSVLLRHYPSLSPALRGVRNAFAPWARTS